MNGILNLYGAELQLYGQPLVLYYTPPPVEDTARSGGGWWPVVYVDRDGNPVDLDEKIEAAVEAATITEVRAVQPSMDAVADRMNDAAWIVANRMQIEAENVLQLMERVDAYLAEMIRRDIAAAVMDAYEQEAVAILLLAN
jgi:hypothetical protein